MLLSSCDGYLGILSEDYYGNVTEPLRLPQEKGLLSSFKENLGILLKLVQGNRASSRFGRETQGSSSDCDRNLKHSSRVATGESGLVSY